MCSWVSTSRLPEKANENVVNKQKCNFYKRWRHEIRYKAPFSLFRLWFCPEVFRRSQHLLGVNWKHGYATTIFSVRYYATKIFSVRYYATKIYAVRDKDTTKPCPSAPSPNTSEYRWTGHSRTTDTLSHFARSWHHASHSWGGLLAPAGATTLRIATLALVRSTAEYCAPVWCRSALIRLIDALRIVTGCLRPTPADNLPTLAGIQPAELRRNGAALSLARRAMEPGHLLHSPVHRV